VLPWRVLGHAREELRRLFALSFVVVILLVVLLAPIHDSTVIPIQ
jgi:hypothetical protein